MRCAAIALWLLGLAGVASAQQHPGYARWEQGGVYRTLDGYGAVIERKIEHLAGDDVVFVVRIIEVPPPGQAKRRWKHDQQFWVSEWDHLGPWLPAYLCFTGPRSYTTPDGNHFQWETDRYTSFRPCPAVPIE